MDLKYWQPRPSSWIRSSHGSQRYMTILKGLSVILSTLLLKGGLPNSQRYLLTYLLTYIYSIVSAGARIPQVSKTAKVIFFIADQQCLGSISFWYRSGSWIRPGSKGSDCFNRRKIFLFFFFVFRLF